MKKSILFLCVAALILSACTKEQIPVANYDIIPQPKETHLSRDITGYFILQPSTKVYFENGLQHEAEFLSEYVNDIMRKKAFI